MAGFAKPQTERCCNPDFPADTVFLSHTLHIDLSYSGTCAFVPPPACSSYFCAELLHNHMRSGFVIHIYGDVYVCACIVRTTRVRDMHACFQTDKT